MCAQPDLSLTTEDTGRHENHGNVRASVPRVISPADASCLLAPKICTPGGTVRLEGRLGKSVAATSQTASAEQILQAELWSIKEVMFDPEEFPSQSSFDWGGSPPCLATDVLNKIGRPPYSAYVVEESSPVSVKLDPSK